MNIIHRLEQAEIARVMDGRSLPEFAVGDTVRVNVKVIEGTRERVQAYEGVCIGRKNNGIGSSFTVRKISYGEGVERVFPLFSPRIDSVEVVRRGRVRRAKLYYMRNLRGKAARIKERTTGHGMTPTAQAAASEARNAARAEAARAKAAAAAAPADAG